MTMQEKLIERLSALGLEHLEVVDESHMHSRGLETHFKATLVGELFAGLNLVKRHQKVYAQMGELMGQIHALAIHTYTLQEWAATGAVAPASPTCRGGHQ